jgi:hypothetical protein
MGVYKKFVICSRLEQKLSEISKILKRRILCSMMLKKICSLLFAQKIYAKLGTGWLKNEIGHMTH